MYHMKYEYFTHVLLFEWNPLEYSVLSKLQNTLHTVFSSHLNIQSFPGYRTPCTLCSAASWVFNPFQVTKHPAHFALQPHEYSILSRLQNTLHTVLQPLEYSILSRLQNTPHTVFSSLMSIHSFPSYRTPCTLCSPASWVFNPFQVTEHPAHFALQPHEYSILSKLQNTLHTLLASLMSIQSFPGYRTPCTLCSPAAWVFAKSSWSLRARHETWPSIFTARKRSSTGWKLLSLIKWTGWVAFFD